MTFNVAGFARLQHEVAMESFIEVNDTRLILDDLVRINQGGKGRFGSDKDRHRNELLERAKANDGHVSPHEYALIQKAVNGTLTPEEREELINLLPAEGKQGFNETEAVRGKSNQELLDEVRDVHRSEAGFNGNDYNAIHELLRRASLDGKMSAELNALFHKLRAGKDLTSEEFARFTQLLQEEDNIV